MNPKVLAGGIGGVIGLLSGCVAVFPLGELFSRFMKSAGSPQEGAPLIGYSLALAAPFLGFIGGIFVASWLMNGAKPRGRLAERSAPRRGASDDGQQR